MTEADGKLVRCWLRCFEFNFDVEYRAGVKDQTHMRFSV